MKTIDVNIKDEVYSVEHPISTVNLYRIKHAEGFVEITRNRESGRWKILNKKKTTLKLPLQPIGRAIEKSLDIVN